MRALIALNGSAMRVSANGRTDATKHIISLASRSKISAKHKILEYQQNIKYHISVGRDRTDIVAIGYRLKQECQKLVKNKNLDKFIRAAFH